MSNSKSRPSIFWHTSQRTKKYFTPYIRDNIRVIEDISQIKSTHLKKGKKWYNRYQLFKNSQVDLVFVDGFGLSNLLLLLLSKKFNVPYIVRVRGGMCSEFDDLAKMSGKRFAKIYSLYNTKIRNIILHNADHLVPASIFGKTQIIYELPKVDARKITVLYEPTDATIFEQSKRGRFKNYIGAEKESKIILSATNFNYRRKYEAIVYYYKDITNILEQNDEWIYVVIGKGAGIDGFRKEIQKITPKGISNRVIIAGYYDKIEEALTDTDIFLYLSFRDMAPQALKEAQTAGKPIIVNHTCGGALEFIPSQLHQRYVIETHKDITSTLEELIISKETREKVGSINKEWATENYSISKCSHTLINILYGTLDKRGIK